MKLLILCALFAPIIYMAFKQKKWYLYLMTAFVGILPEQFSVRVHDSLPLLTVSRVLILVAIAFWLVERIKPRRFSVPKSLWIYFGVNVALALFHLFFDLDEIKHIAVLLVERALVMILLKDMIESREEFERCVDFLILGCCAVSVIGICQTVFDYDIASALHLTETMSSIILSPRMGLTRAYGTFNAISFGCYLSMMLLPIYYRLEKTRLHRYSVAFALTFSALICTFTRSAWLCVAAVFFFIFLLRRLKMIKRLVPGVAMAVALCLLLCLPQPKLMSAFVQTGRSVINTVLMAIPSSPSEDPSPSDPSASTPDVPEKDENKPPLELDEEFGPNGSDPSYSRMAQWSAVRYMIGEGKLLVGYGYNAFPEGKLHFYFDRWLGEWEVAKMLDVGLVALMTEFGLLGTLTHAGLLVYIAIYCWLHRRKDGAFGFYRMTLYSLPLYLLLNFLASFLYAELIWLLWGLFYAYSRLDKELPPEQVPAADEQPASGIFETIRRKLCRKFP